MKLPPAPRQPLVAVALAASAGIVVAEFFQPPLLLLCGIIALGAALTVWRPAQLQTQLLVLAGFCALHLFQEQDCPGRILAEQLGGQPRTVTVVGTVANEPKPGASGYTDFLLNLREIEVGDQRQLSNATIAARWKGEPEFGDTIRLTGIAEPIPPPRNPGVFDMRSYLARHGVYRSVFARYPENGEVLGRDGSNLIMRAAIRARRAIQNCLTNDLRDSPEVCALISGMTLGLRHETPDDIEQPFQQTGTLHLFAVAGLHVGIIAQLLWLLAMLIRLPRRAAAAVIIPCLFFYSAITGLHVSSVRAATMAALLLGGILVDRPVLTLNSLAAGALAILAWDTNQLFSSGFQLSFAVVAAIILLREPFRQMLLRPARTDPFLPRSLVSPARRTFEVAYGAVAGAASVSMAAWLGSALLILYYFYLVAPISLGANLLVVPLAYFMLAVAMISLLSAPISSSVSIAFNNANWSLAKVMLGLVHGLAQVPAGHVYVEPHWPNGAPTELTVLDAGAGAAIHLRSLGKDWLVDCGSQRDYLRFVRDYLHSRGTNRLEGLLLTHGDSLHIGGAVPLLGDFRPRHVIDSPIPDKSRVHQNLLSLTNREVVSRGATFLLSQAVRVEVLHPPPALAAKVADDRAIVLRLKIGSHRVLLVSDSGFPTENTLLAHPDELRADILIKGQHISGESGSPQFLDAVRPRLIIATSVDFPRAQRISDDWAAMVRGRGIRLFRQDETGAVKIEFFRDRWQATAFLGQETFRSSSR